MKKLAIIYLFAVAALVNGCDTKDRPSASGPDDTFEKFKDSFLDAYWKQYPAGSIFIGYGKYYDTLVIPGHEAIESNINFSRRWIDSLKSLPYDNLHDNNKISFDIIKNQLESDIWYQSVFKDDEWDASSYNLSGECYYIINQPYAPLDHRLRILSKHLQHADEYYKAAYEMLREPTREHIGLAIKQNEGGLSVFGKELTDSIQVSGLSDEEKDRLRKNVTITVEAIERYVKSLKQLLADKNYKFRSFRIGKELFTEKFKYDLVTTLTPEDLYNRAQSDKKIYYSRMFTIASDLWGKYYGSQTRPSDTITTIKAVLEKINLQHAAPEHFFDSLTNHVERLKKFVLQKQLFDFDTAYPMKVRIMPAYLSGVAVAGAEFTPPYQKQGTTYYNIDDLTTYPKKKAESTLREYNNYSAQILSIHEAIPGHCLQGIYNNKNSPDVVRSVFQNGAMVEGWAVYTEGMMLDNGWGNHAPEMELIHGKWKLRELANVIVDYDIHCLNKPKSAIMDLLIDDCFQTEAQADEKYHRATVSQVQLCSYYAGYIAISDLRDGYQKKMGDQYSLRGFHEKFLSFGSSPVKYIRERMLE